MTITAATLMVPERQSGATRRILELVGNIAIRRLLPCPQLRMQLPLQPRPSQLPRLLSQLPRLPSQLPRLRRAPPPPRRARRATAARPTAARRTVMRRSQAMALAIVAVRTAPKTITPVRSGRVRYHISTTTPRPGIQALALATTIIAAIRVEMRRQSGASQQVFWRGGRTAIQRNLPRPRLPRWRRASFA